MNVVGQEYSQTMACYKVLRQNSLESFKKFISNEPDDEKLFQSLASAIINLNVRNIRLKTELRLFVEWKLADYGYRKLTGDWQNTGVSDGWKQHIAVISNCWRDIVAHQYDDNAIVDDRFLHRLRMIHNHLYFLQFKKCLKHLPIWEVVFCVAIFMCIYVQPDNYRYYRMMISKSMVIEWLAELVTTLERVKDDLEQMEPVLRRIVSDKDDSRYDPLIVELMNKLQATNISNKEYIVDKFRKIRESEQCDKGELAKQMVEQFKHKEKNYYKEKMDELKTLQSKDGLPERIKEQLVRIVHPTNVCEKLRSEMKSKTSTDTIVNIVIADAEFGFADLSLGPGVIGTIRQCYRQMKQFYSLVKIHGCISIITQLDPSNKKRFVACIKRTLTVMGEAINHTKNTPNMPDNLVHAAVQRMLTYQFKDINIKHRNTLTHDLSRNRTDLAEETEWEQLKLLPQYMRVVGVTLELLLIAIGAIIRHSFYGMLYRCETLDSLRALLIHVGEKDIFRAVEDDWWDDVSQYYADASKLMEHVHQKPIGQTPHFAEALRAFNDQRSTSEELRQFKSKENAFNYESVRKTCFACEDLSAIKNLLSWKLHSYSPSETLEAIANSWDANIPALIHIARVEKQLLQLNPMIAASTLIKLRNSLISADHQYANHTKELITKLDCNQTLDETELEKLTEKLVPYYKNIFRLDTKENVLKKFCKGRRLSWDIAKLLAQDRHELQEMFDDRRSRLCLFLMECGIHTKEDLIAKLYTVPYDAMLAMEYVQLELCEMLLAVKYFSDNFEALKHSIPMIQGKSYRNYLAHDALSYDTVTCSNKAKCIINAFIFAHTSVSLFSDRAATVPPMSFPSLEDTKQWIEQQLELRDAVVKGDESRVQAVMNAGGELMGQYYDSPDVRYERTTLHYVPAFVEWSGQVDPNVAALLNRHFTDFEAKFKDPKRRICKALDRRDFEEAYGLWQELNLPSTTIDASLLAWPDIPAVFIAQKASQEGWQAVLEALFDYGNEQGAQLLIMSENNINAQTEASVLNKLLHYAMLRGLLQSARLLFSKMRCLLDPQTVELAIVVHWNELLKQDTAKPALDDDGKLELYLHAAVSVTNYEAMEYLFNHCAGRNRVMECYLAAASQGKCDVLETLFVKHPPANDDVLARPLYQAVANQHWDCARLLLAKNASADVVYFENDDETSVLHLLVQRAMVDLIRCIKNFNIQKFCDASTQHPVAVAIDYEKDSQEMCEAIALLEFGYLENPTVLHAMVGEGCDHFLWNCIWKQIDQELSRSFEMYGDRFKLLMKVLHRWYWIAFIEKPYAGNTTLSSAVKADNEFDVLDKLINRARSMRTFEEDGLVLGNIAIWEGSAMERSEYKTLNEVYRSCARYTGQTERQWQDILIPVGELSIKFIVLNTTTVNHEAVSHLWMGNSTALADNLHDLLSITNALFNQHLPVFATVSMGIRTIHFLRIEDRCCAYDVFPSGSEIDLSNMVNTRLARGRTVLYNAIKYGCDGHSLALLVENGANPLLADEYECTPIDACIERTDDPYLAVFLLEACLRNENGDSPVATIGERDKKTLLNLANLCHHHKAAELLERW